MKKNVFLLFILLSMTFSAFSQSLEEKEAKQFANKLFYTVKKNDLEGFKKFSMTLPDWEKTLATTKLSKDEKQKQLAAGKEDILAYHERKSFDRIQKAIKREFITWTEITIKDLTYAVEKRGALKYMTFKLIFTFENKTFVFSAKDCVKTPTGWKMTKGADLSEQK